MLFTNSILFTALAAAVAAAPATSAPAPNTGVGNNYFYMGCYPWNLIADPSIVSTSNSYGAGNGGVGSIQDCAALCSSYYAYIVGDGSYCYCLNNRSLFPPTHESLNPVCRRPCANNPNQMCGGNVGSGMFSLFEQA